MENKRRKLDASSFAIVDVLRIFKRWERNRKDEDGDD
jgi:hypothetical protein